jgi:hypothetical protein
MDEKSWVPLTLFLPRHGRRALPQPMMGRMVSWKRADWLAITVARIPGVEGKAATESRPTHGSSRGGGARTVPCPHSGHITY